MVSTNPELGKPFGADQGTQIYVQASSPVIDEYRALYLQFAKIAQSFIPSITTTLETFDALYQLGCDDPKLSREIDKNIAGQLRLSSYSQDDRFRILYQGPYIQSQKVCHFISDEGAKSLVNELLIEPRVRRLPQPQSFPTTAA